MMRHDIRELVFFEKLATISRIKSVFEVLWHLDLVTSINKTVVNILFRNIVTGELVTDSIAPEYLKFCSVGSFFEAGKKLENKKLRGEFNNISINVPEAGFFNTLGTELNDTKYDLNFVTLNKDGRPNTLLLYLSKKQKCMVFMKKKDKILIPCSVIAATYYLRSHSMRVQLLAQNLHGLYEAIHYDPYTETARIILNTNARTEDAKHIARFALSQHATQCWDNVMNSMRKLTYSSKDGRNYCGLIAKIPFVQEKLDMIVRCDSLPNSTGGTTKLVHDILDEWGELPFRKLCIARHANAPPTKNTTVITKQSANTDHKVTARSPSKAYTGHWVEQFDVPHNPLWKDVEFEEVILPSRHEVAQTKTMTLKATDKKVSLSPQRSKVNNPDNLVANAFLVQKEPKRIDVPRMPLSEFREMVGGFQEMENVAGFFVSMDLRVPFRHVLRRHRYTMRESYDNSRWNRRRYLYVTFCFKGRQVCLVEFDQAELPARVGTYVMIASTQFSAVDAEKAAQHFVGDARNRKVEEVWKNEGVIFDTKSHPVNNAKEHWQSWREKVLEMVELRGNKL